MRMKKFFTLIAVAYATLSMNATEIFKFTLADGAADVTIDAENQMILGKNTTDPEYTSYTITEGASLTLYNGHASTAKKLIVSGKIDLGGSGGSYVKVDLPSGVTLKSGDIIKLLDGTAAGGAISYSSSKVTSDNMSSTNEYIVPADGDGKSTFYIWRGATKPKFTGVTVERNENQTNPPTITVENGKVVMTCGTAGASIYYATATGVTPSTGTLYSAPLAITSSVTYYAVAQKEGMEVSKEASMAVEYAAIPTDATLGATLKATATIPAGDSDQDLENITEGTFTATKGTESDAALANTAPYGTHAIAGLVKVKKTVTIATTGDKDIAAIRVKGISNSDGNTQAVTATGMKFTTGNNLLPPRDTATEPGVVDLVAETPGKSFAVFFSGQARVMFEVYTITSTGIQEVKKFEATDDAIYNLAGQKVDASYKGVVIKDGKKMIQK